MADATATNDYDVKVEDIAGSRKRITVTIPPAMIDEKIEHSMGTLTTETALPGFRKGRAPKALLERRFGSTIRQETKNQLIADGYSIAIERGEIKPVSEPEPVGSFDELELVAGKPFVFAVDVEVVPEFDMPNLEGIEITKPVIEVTDEHVEAELTRQRTQFGEIKKIDSGFQEGDRVVGPGHATIAGQEEPFFTHDNIDVIVPGERDGGRGNVLGLIIEDLRERLDGVKVGDTLSFVTTGPVAHEMEEIRGKEITIVVQVREGQRIVPSEIATVLDQYGLASEAILREQIRHALEQRRDEEQRAAMRDQVYAHLAGSVEFELPAKLSATQAGRMLERYRLELMYRGGLSVDEVETRLAELRAETETQSRTRLKLSFLLHRLAEHFQVEVTDQEVNGRIAAIAIQRGMRPEKLRSDLIQSGGIGQIATQLREHKAADRVIDEANVNEMDAVAWNKKVAERHAERRRQPDAKSGSTKKTTAKKTAEKTAEKTAAKKTTTKKKTTRKKTSS